MKTKAEGEEQEWTGWRRWRRHHYVILNPKKMGVNGAASSSTAASVIYLSLFPTCPISLLHPIKHQSFSNYTLSLHKSNIIISMVTGSILRRLWPFVGCNCSKSHFQRTGGNTVTDPDIVTEFADFRGNILFNPTITALQKLILEGSSQENTPSYCSR